MYIHNLLLTCSTLLASTMSLVFAAPCYTTTPGGCDEDKSLIFVEKSTTKSGNICTDFINASNQRVVFCYPKSIESGYSPRSFEQRAYTQREVERTVVTIIPSGGGKTSSYSEPTTQTTQRVDNDTYWQGYNQGYERGYNNGSPYGRDDFKPVGRNDNRVRAAGRPVK